MTLWVAAHLGVSPASNTIRVLDEWQISLIYEVVMNYTVEGLRKSYFDRRQSVENINDDALLTLGYSMDEIAKIKGKG
jgi:hypothetical protein